MFIHNFIYSFKALFRNKMLVFWTFAFPIIMAILFYVSFSNIEEDEKLKAFPIAIVKNEEFEKNEIYKKTFEILGNEEKEGQLFFIKYTDLKEAKELLEKEEITGYLQIEEEIPKVVVKRSGLNETVFQNIVKEIQQKKKMIEDIVSNKVKEEIAQGKIEIDYQVIYDSALQDIQIEQIDLIKDRSREKLDYTMIEYYTLIAMACLYGAIFGMTAINNLLANMSKKGMRISIAPITKTKMVLSSSLAAFIIQLIGIALLFVFTIFIFKVDYGNNFLLILLLALAGCLAGLSLGVCIGAVIRKSENMKTGILIAFTMLGCFLSGMMGITMKYVVDTNFPWINKINPASMITDGFYSLYYYDTLDRYWLNLISLIIFSVGLLTISAVIVRRQKYDSI